MLEKELKELILKFCLLNAVQHSGKAEEKAVLGKVLAENPQFKTRIEELREEITRTIQEVNRLGVEEQKKELESLAPELLEKKAEKQGLPELKFKGKFITRFAPSPTGPLNIFHFLRPLYIPYWYARKYNGTWILRFDDTDPRNIEKRFYEWILEDLKNFGIKPDKIIYQSDFLEECYEYAERLIQGGNAYICLCPAEKFREYKQEKRDCPCRDGKYNEKWQEMLEGKLEEGQAVLRLKTGMQEANPALRDPPLLRVIKAEHPRKGRRYSLWPVYNFACVICDHLEKISHVFRGKEHEHNTQIQSRIYSALGWKGPEVINFGMIYLPVEKMHTRDIKKAIQEGRLRGWDDPSLPTLRALLRRGFQPEALKELALKIGLTKTDIKLGWENVEAFNRKIIDRIANRYFAVIDPVKIKIKGLEKGKVKLKRHPDVPERGEREIPYDPERIWVSREDFEKFRGREIRLIGLCNLKLDLEAEFTGTELRPHLKKIQWVSEPHHPIRLVKPKEELEGLGEPELKRAELGEVIQLERIGFGRIDSKEPLVIFWAHP